MKKIILIIIAGILIISPLAAALPVSTPEKNQDQLKLER